MRALRVVSLCALAAFAAAQAGLDPYWHRHEACTSGSSFRIKVDESATTVYSGSSTTTLPILQMPNGATSAWPDGPQFASTLQSQGMFPTTAPIVSATWNKTTDFLRNDVMTFTTNDNQQIVVASDNCGYWYNCGYSGSYAYNAVHCYDDEWCCKGSPDTVGTCIPKSSGDYRKRCCYHVNNRRACFDDQTCTSNYMGYNSTCCEAGYTGCLSDQSMGGTCCRNGASTCCAGSGEALCCLTGTTCVINADSNNYRRPSCVASSTTSTAPAATTAPGEVRACLVYSSSSSGAAIYYDIRSGPSGTTLQRSANGQLLDSNWYATLHMPTAGTTTWDEGVGYAATMQTRNAWVNSEPTQAATWETVNGETVWRFSTTIGGSPVQLVFRSSNCIGGGSQPGTPTPAPLPTTFRMCAPRQYDVFTISYASSNAMVSPSGTTFEHRGVNGGVLNSETYAALHRPAPGTITWDEGVAFADTMMVRGAWGTTGPVQSATWEVLADGDEAWTFRWQAPNGQTATRVYRRFSCWLGY